MVSVPLLVVKVNWAWAAKERVKRRRSGSSRATEAVMRAGLRACWPKRHALKGLWLVTEPQWGRDTILKGRAAKKRKSRKKPTAGLWGSEKPLQRFCRSPALIRTQLKQGVNEKGPFMSQPCKRTLWEIWSLLRPGTGAV